MVRNTQETRDVIEAATREALRALGSRVHAMTKTEVAAHVQKAVEAALYSTN